MKSVKLVYNSKTEVGEVEFPDDWKDLYAIIKLDCLRDWIFDLEKEYEACLSGFEKKETADE